MFDTKALYALKQSLNGLAMRQKAIAGNIANAETPGYQAQTVSFEEKLETVLNSMDGMNSFNGSELNSIKLSVSPRQSISQRVDGNTVDTDTEMAELAETSLRYEAAAKLVSRKYQLLRSIIMEGKR